MKYFADTFAIIEYLKDNSRFIPFFEKHEIILTKLNLMELYYSALLEQNEEIAEKYYSSFLDKTIEISDHVIKEAVKFRFRNKMKNMSYVDCIGYQIAKTEKCKFLTGDKAFKEIPNVEWIPSK
ncbi:MAG: PIN domain-containing protein [Candidatus Diapherotrites archaeon]